MPFALAAAAGAEDLSFCHDGEQRCAPLRLHPGLFGRRDGLQPAKGLNGAPHAPLAPRDHVLRGMLDLMDTTPLTIMALLNPSRAPRRVGLRGRRRGCVWARNPGRN